VIILKRPTIPFLLVLKLSHTQTEKKVKKTSLVLTRQKSSPDIAKKISADKYWQCHNPGLKRCTNASPTDFYKMMT
jgi:hypothetical protein